jgi:hypothetical protein
VYFASFGSLFTGYSLAVFAFTIGPPTFYSSLGLAKDPTSPDYSYTNDIIGAANGVFLGTGCTVFLAVVKPLRSRSQSPTSFYIISLKSRIKLSEAVQS